MRTPIVWWLALGVTGCGALTPMDLTQPLLLSSQTVGGTASALGINTALSNLDRGPQGLGQGQPVTLASTWASGFASLAAAPLFWRGISGLSDGGLAAVIPTGVWQSGSAWGVPNPLATLGQSRLNALPAPPGWGDRNWGGTGSTPVQAAGNTWGNSPTPGQYNLSRGAGGIGGWGIDTGFFTIPQAEQRRKLDQTLQDIDTRPGPVSSGGATKLDPKLFPFLHPVKGPLVPPK
ncbi:MAG: hypothetical protein H7338_22355 [Candidatus Sericytochromatia bacterium]|nr:hypothetical protein [Candidatus Sericytochromatia bacterium]